MTGKIRRKRKKKKKLYHMIFPLKIGKGKKNKFYMIIDKKWLIIKNDKANKRTK